MTIIRERVVNASEVIRSEGDTVVYRWDLQCSIVFRNANRGINFNRNAALALAAKFTKLHQKITDPVFATAFSPPLFSLPHFLPPHFFAAALFSPPLFSPPHFFRRRLFRHRAFCAPKIQHLDQHQPKQPETNSPRKQKQTRPSKRTATKTKPLRRPTPTRTKTAAATKTNQKKQKDETADATEKDAGITQTNRTARAA